MGLLDDFRAQNPAYKDASDEKLSEGLYNKFYAGKLSRDAFNAKIGIVPPTLKGVTTESIPKDQQDTQQTTEDKGLVGNIQQDIQNRFNTGSDIMKSNQNPLSKGWQMGGKVVAGTANDIMSEAAKSAYPIVTQVLNKIPGIGQGPGLEATKKTLESIANSSWGKEALNAINEGRLAYVNWANKPENKEKAANFESFIDIASVLPAGKVAGALGNVAGKTVGEATMISPITRGFGPSVDKLRETTNKLKNTATSTIEKAKKSKATLSPNLPDDAKKEISDIEELSTSGDIANAPKTHASVQKFLSSLSPDDKNISQGDLSLRNLLGHRQAFDSLVGQGGAEGIAAKKVSQSIEKIIDSAIKNDEIKVGNKKDLEGLSQFKKQWSKAKQHETLVNALESAQEDSNKAKKAMQKIRDSDYYKTFPDVAKQAINTGSKGRTRAAILDAVGKISKVANFKNLGWAELAAILTHSPSLAIGAAAVSGVAKLAKEGGKKIHQGDIRKAITAVENSK